jgi:hypothetical protein
MSPHQFLQDVLTLVLFIVWAFKIGFHFNYLKAIDSNIKERSFITFYLNPVNIIGSITLVIPIFINGKRSQENEKSQILRRSTAKSVLLFWLILAGLCFYKYT